MFPGTLPRCGGVLICHPLMMVILLCPVTTFTAPPPLALHLFPPHPVGRRLPGQMITGVAFTGLGQATHCLPRAHPFGAYPPLPLPLLTDDYGVATPLRPHLFRYLPSLPHLVVRLLPAQQLPAACTPLLAVMVVCGWLLFWWGLNTCLRTCHPLPACPLRPTPCLVFLTPQHTVIGPVCLPLPRYVLLPVLLVGSGVLAAVLTLPCPALYR